MRCTVRGKVYFLLLVLIFTGTVNGWAQEEPPLPSGLDEEPVLPEGLGEPGDEKATTSQEPETISIPFGFSGFWEGRIGFRTQKDSHEKDLSLGESRVQLQIDQAWEILTFRLTTDFLYDPVLDRHTVQLEEGKGFLDLREASFLVRPLAFMDLKIGRQILTWGTGDLIFINDLFPKDWNAFFIGRDPEYLKAPSDAVKLSLFLTLLNIDLVYTPRFDPDRFIDGSRISFFNGLLGRRSGRDAVVQVDKRDRWFEDDEIAWRLYKNIRGYELAAYGYKGFWKSPGGVDPIMQRVTFRHYPFTGGVSGEHLAGGLGILSLVTMTLKGTGPGKIHSHGTVSSAFWWDMNRRH